MCIKPICINLDHLAMFSWNRTRITNVPEGFLCFFNEGPSQVLYLLLYLLFGGITVAFLAYLGGKYKGIIWFTFRPYFRLYSALMSFPSYVKEEILI